MWHSGLRICVVTAASWIRSLARELLHALDTAKKKKKKKKKKDVLLKMRIQRKNLD